MAGGRERQRQLRVSRWTRRRTHTLGAGRQRQRPSSADALDALNRRLAEVRQADAEDRPEVAE
jgi:hypothetical protein